MSTNKNSNGAFARTALRGAVASLKTYFKSIQDTLSRSCKLHLSYVANDVRLSSSRTYIFHPSVSPVWDNASDMKDAVVET